MKHTFLPLLALSCAAMAACNPEDRSGEQPFAPQVSTLGAVTDGPRATLYGSVDESLNSSIRKVGFVYGNDTLRLRVEQTDGLQPGYSLTTDSLGAGTYFYAAFATNGVGTTYADTLTFVIGEE